MTLALEPFTLPGMVGEAAPSFWYYLAIALTIGLAVVVSAHIVLTKSDSRSAVAWVGLVWLSPVIGSALYGMFGINRIRRRAGRLRSRPRLSTNYTSELAAAQQGARLIPADMPRSMNALATLVGNSTGNALLADNRIEPLRNGDETYPAMLEAIGRARESIALATYIFDNDDEGARFVAALAAAKGRGVEVRVLIDDVGARYSRPPITQPLSRAGIRVARFMRSKLPFIPTPYVNLRNHRKIMVVDGSLGFTGGMNIRGDCVLASDPKFPTADFHFRITGPVVLHLMETFAFDWHFTTGERLEGPRWFPPSAAAGTVVARGIPDGPDEDFETILLTIMGALDQAEETVRIATPYFLPEAPMIDALRVAAMRGVRVDIVLPEQGNLRFVQWAMTALLPQVVRWGCRVYVAPAPFDHAKVMVVDGAWALIGSANMDPRSLRLNFEFCVEAYDRELAGTLDRFLDDRIAASRRVTLEELRARPLALQLRDGVVKLAQPYL